MLCCTNNSDSPDIPNNPNNPNNPFFTPSQSKEDGMANNF